MTTALDRPRRALDQPPPDVIPGQLDLPATHAAPTHQEQHMTEYSIRDLAVREQAFQEAHQRITDFMDELRAGAEGHTASWRTESTVDALDFAAMKVNGLAGWARAELDAAEDQLELGGDRPTP